MSEQDAGLSVSGRSPARVVVIGLGHGAERITLPALSTTAEVEIKAGCDEDPARAEEAKNRWGIPKVYTDAGEMLDRERADTVVIATPPQTHLPLTKLALERGCHVMCEKPFMPSVEAADEVITLAEEKGLVVAVNEQYYQMPIYRRARQLLDSGEIGRLYQAQVWQHMYQVPEEEGSWKTALGPRRVLFEFGTHVVDLMRHFFGDYPSAVTAQTAKPRSDIVSDACISLRLDFPGERVANITLNRASRAPKKYLEMRLSCERASLRASLGGVANLSLGWNSEKKRPRVRMSLATGGELRLERAGGSRLLISQSDRAFSEAARTHFKQFITAIREGSEPVNSARQAREVQRVIFTAYESVERAGELVKL